MAGRKSFKTIHVHIGSKGAVGEPYPELWVPERLCPRTHYNRRKFKYRKNKRLEAIYLKRLRKLALERTKSSIRNELSLFESQKSTEYMNGS